MKKIIFKVGLAAIAFMVTACTKDAPFKRLPKSQQLVDLNQLDALKESEFQKLSQKLNAETVVKDDWLAVTSYGKSSRSSSEARSFWMGSENLVRFVKTKDALILTTIEEDTRFQGNPTNHRPILSIPARYVEYRCSADAFGECTNQEEENNDIPWQDRHMAELDFGKAEFLSQEVLPLEIKNLFDGCFSEIQSNLTGLTLEAGALNIQLEKTIKVSRISPDCLGKAHGIGIEDLSFRVQYTHSIVKMDRLISKDFERVFYPADDEYTFGFFNTTVNKLAIDNRDVQNGTVSYLNRWNPARKHIAYNLSDEFFKPENKKILDATYMAINHINTALNKAGSNLGIDLSGEQGKNPNDLRNNTIVMVEDPANSGVIGYGPSVANPRTGEIVHARTVMYLGVIKQLAYRGYEEVRRQILEEKTNGSELGGDVEPVEASSGKALRNNELSKSKVLDGFESIVRKHKSTENLTFNFDKYMSEHLEFVKSQEKVAFGNIKKTSAVKDLVTYKTDAKRALSLSDKLRLGYKTNIQDDEQSAVIEEQLKKDWSKDCLYDGTIASLSIIRKILKEREEIPRPWAQLSDDEKQEIMDMVVPEIWITTLVHELGHNLGLRHNFAGSEDKDNFYSVEELANLGITDEQIPYSSMMEYTYRTIGALPTLGKYDIAALQFGYSRKIDLANGQTAEFIKIKDGNGRFVPGIRIGDSEIKVSSEREQTVAFLEANNIALKPFKFCTDEMVGANPGCKVFDEGSTFSEIALHLIKTYEDFYRIRYQRNDRREYSLIDENLRASRTADLMMDMRMFFETVERIENMFGLELDNTLWTSNPFLADLRVAADIAGRFLAKVMLTPDVHCAISLKSDPKKVVDVFQLKDVNPQWLSCFDQEVKELVKSVGENQDEPIDLIVSGQGGKSFQSIRDINNPDSRIDQIDTQGIWIDKLIAQEMLLGREMGLLNSDKYQGNFLNLPELRRDIIGTLAGIVNGEVTAPIDFRNEWGIVQPYKAVDKETKKEVLTKALPVKFSLAKADHIIQRPIMRGFGKALGLPDMQTNYRTQVLASFHKQMESINDATTAENLLKVFSVVRALPNDRLDPADGYLTAKVLTKRFASKPENGIAHGILVDVRVGQILKTIKSADLLSLLQSLEPIEETHAEYVSRAAELFHKIDNANAGEQLPTAIQIARELGFDAILDFASGDLISEERAYEIFQHLL